jgi:phosphatidylethanolamine N-methyltransferase
MEKVTNKKIQKRFLFNTKTFFCIVFKVPLTREMVQSLADPNEKKSFFDILTLTTLLLEVALLFTLPRQVGRVFFLLLFFFWRIAYNVGLGFLLKYQSEQKGLVKLAKEYKIFDEKAHPRLVKWLKMQLSMKMGSDYNFDVSCVRMTGDKKKKNLY